MIQDPCSIDHAIGVLNEALKLDAGAMHRLVETRVPCNAALGNHPSIQVGAGAAGEGVGVLGLINGIFGADELGHGAIVAAFDVVCPKCSLRNPASQVEGDVCPTCGEVLGSELMKFQRRVAD